YRKAFVEASFRDQRAVILKGQAGKELQEVIYRLSHYVDAIALGDPAIIVAAGFRPSESNTARYDRTPKAENRRVSHIQVGLGIVRIWVQPRTPARRYRYVYRKKGSAGWASILHTKSTIEMRDLDKLQEYEFRTSYIGRDIEPNYSDVIAALVVSRPPSRDAHAGASTLIFIFTRAYKHGNNNTTSSFTYHHAPVRPHEPRHGLRNTCATVFSGDARPHLGNETAHKRRPSSDNGFPD